MEEVGLWLASSEQRLTLFVSWVILTRTQRPPVLYFCGSMGVIGMYEDLKDKRVLITGLAVLLAVLSCKTVLHVNCSMQVPS